jgi:hypothetical protein
MLVHALLQQQQQQQHQLHLHHQQSLVTHTDCEGCTCWQHLGVDGLVTGLCCLTACVGMATGARACFRGRSGAAADGAADRPSKPCQKGMLHCVRFHQLTCMRSIHDVFAPRLLLVLPDVGQSNHVMYCSGCMASQKVTQGYGAECCLCTDCNGCCMQVREVCALVEKAHGMAAGWLLSVPQARVSHSVVLSCCSSHS